MDENEIFDAFGLTPEQPAEGGNEQVVAEPAAQSEQTPAAEGEKEQEVAEPAQPEGKEGAETPDEPGKEAREPLSEQERHKNASMRRSLEQKRSRQQAAVDAAVQKAVQAEQEKTSAKLAEFFQKAQLKNTFTDTPITNMDEFDAWERAFSAEKLRRDLKAGSLTPEAVQQLIDQTPAMQQIKELAARQEQEQAQQRQQEASARIEAELAEIHKLDPSISTVDDLMRQPNAQEFHAMVMSGKTFLEAYRLVNFDAIVSRAAQSAAQAGKQEALNNVGSKGHLTATTGQRGTGAAPVPADEMEMFRTINPDATEAEIIAYYNKSKS